MSRARIARLATLVADLKARKLAGASAGLAAVALESAGYRVHLWANGEGLTVDTKPGLTAKLDGLRRRGLDPFVAVIRDLEAEADAA